MENMFEALFTNQYAVRISTDGGKSLKGTGVLFLKNVNQGALVITAAHVVDTFLETKENDENRLYLTFTDGNNQYQIMNLKARIIDRKKTRDNHSGDIYIHPDYQKKNLIHDIAVICIPWKNWMESIHRYRIEAYRIQTSQQGWGFPLSMDKEWKKDSINELSGKRELKGTAGESGEKGYTFNYTAEVLGYKISRDDFAKGFSGTGLFEGRNGTLCLVGIVSQPCGDDAAGTMLWASKATWLYEIDDELRYFQEENDELSKLLETLLLYCEKQTVLAHNSSMNLKSIEPSLYTDIVDDYSHEFIANENQSALLKKLESIEQSEYSGKETHHLIMIGEGGIGKTATMLGSCRYLLESGRPAIYIPFRVMNDEDTLSSYILRDIFENNHVLGEYVKAICHGKDRNCRKIYMFLDGFNELREERRDIIIEEIESWSCYNNIQIIISSRRTLEEDGNCGFLAQRITMKRLKWEKVADYLKEKDIDVPDKEKMSEILGIPLMLKLYTVVLNSKEKKRLFISGNKLYNWKSDMTNSNNILWNYIQCQIYNAEKLSVKQGESDYTILDLVIAAEYMAPFIASRMNNAGLYIADERQVIDWLREGIELFKSSPLTERICEIKRRKYFLKWDKNCLNEDKIFYLLVYKLNLLIGGADGRISFEHQDFQDILHYIYIEESIKYFTYDFYIGAMTNSKLPYDLITLMSEMMNICEIDSLWDIVKSNKSLSGNYGIHNMIELYKRLNQDNLSAFNFSGIDLRNSSFSGTNLSENGNHTSFQNAIIGSHTFLAEGHNASVTCVDFSSTGGKFVSASYDKTLRVWNTETGTCLAILEGHTHYVRCASWSPNEDKIVSGGDDTNLIIWDVYSYLKKKQISPIVLKKHKGWIYSVGWSCDGRRIASGDSEGCICLWQMNENRQYCFYKTISGQKSSVRCLEWSSVDCSILAGGYENGMLQVWDIQGKSPVLLQGGCGPVKSIAWSPNGHMLAAVCGNSIYIWNINLILQNKRKKKWHWKEGETCCCTCIQGSSDVISSVIWAENFIAFTDNKSICICDLASAYKSGIWIKEDYDISVAEGHTNYINDIAWSHHLKKIISGAEDGTIRIWKPRNLEWNKGWNCIRLIEGNSLPARCVAWSPDNKMIIAGYDDNKLRKWNIEEERCCLVFKGHEKRIKCVAWSGNNIVSGANDSTVRVWDAKTGECKAMMEEHEGAVNCVLWLPDGKRIVSGSDDKKLYIWNFETDKRIPLIGHTDAVYCVAASPDGTILVSGSNDKTLRFWSTEDGTCYEEKTISSASINGHQQPIRGVAWSPDEALSMIISASEDKTLRRWNSETGEAWPQDPTLRGHDDFVYCITWSPNGAFVVSGSTDKTLWLWNAITGEEVDRMRKHSNYVPGVAWSPNGKYISSASCDGTICLWNVSDILNIECEKTFSALPFVDIVDCDFRGAEFESKGICAMIKMNGGIVDDN